MKRVLLLFLCLPMLALAQRKEVLPKEPFNEEDAKSRLAYGNSTIRGVAVARDYSDRRAGIVTGVKHTAPPGTVVVLFPLTDHFKSYLKMKKKYKMSLKYMPVISTEAFRYRIETTVGQNGEFVFERMKPGKYFIETKFDYVGESTAKRQVGTSHSYNVYGHYLYSSPIYQSYITSYGSSSVETAVVEVKKDGEVVKVRL